MTRGDSRRVDVGRLLEFLGVVAKKRGDEWSAPCPIHFDTDPSWHIDENGSWYCFGCTRGGGPANLVSEMLGFDLKTSFEWLESKGLVDDTLGNATSVRVVPGPLLRFGTRCTMPPEVRFGPFQDWPTPVRRYVESRGITPDQVERWGIGFALSGAAACRIVFPIHDESGRLRSWSARAFDDRSPKYMTPKTGADRSAMFGQRYWPPRLERRSETVFLTEGAINALACERVGASYVAALGGSNTKYLSKNAFSALSQIERISHFGHVVIVSDPDGAGDRVAKSLAVLSRYLEVRRAVLPPRTDAADLAVRSLDELRRYLCRATPVSDTHSTGRTERD